MYSSFIINLITFVKQLIFSKSLRMNLKALIILFSFCGFVGFSQQELMEDSIPKVSKIGEYEGYYPDLYDSFENPLLAVCQNDMNLAFDKWMDMLRDMEEYSIQVDYDLKGLKLWINVFWDADGTIKHIMFYPKPNSRNTDLDELSVFLNSFMNNYQMSVDTNIRFNHYGAAAFPTFPKRILSAEK